MSTSSSSGLQNKTYRSSVTRFMEQNLIELSAVRMGKHCQSHQFSVAEIIEGRPDAQLGDEMSMVLIHGDGMSLIFKVHYLAKEATQLASSALGIPVEKIERPVVQSFMNEFNNLMGGFVRGVFDEGEVLVGMSLPILAHGRDELIFVKVADPRYFGMYWKVVADNGGPTVYCSSELLVRDECQIVRFKDKFEEAIRNDRDANQGGEISFF